MATSFGAGAARGIETGFGLGLRADAAAEEKRQRGVQEARQAQADTRAEEELGLRRSADQRAETRLQDAERRDATARATTALTSRRAELLAASTAAQTAGAPVPAGTAEEYSVVSGRLAKLRQAALDDASRLAACQLDLGSMSPAQAFKAVTVGTGMTMKDLAGMPQHANDLQAGIETNNQGLTLQAVNGLFAPRLRQGVGEEAPSDGKITRKEVIRLVPAKDANGRMDPDKVFPVIRVYVQRPGDTQERYYDAPMTRGASVQDEQVEPISVKKSLDWVGNLGVLTTALQRPDIAEKMAQGEREVGPEVQKYFDEFYSLTKPSKKTVTREKVDLGDRVLDREIDITGKVVNQTELKKGATPKLFSPGAGVSTYRAKMADIDQAEVDGDITPEEAAAMRKANMSGIRPTKAAPNATPGEVLANPDLHGEDFLKTLPKADADVVRALAEGKIKPTDISTKGEERRRMLSLALQYKPGADMGKQSELGSREAIFIQRVLLSGNEAAKDLESVTSLPLTASTGLFGGRKQGVGLMDAAKEVLANKMTGQEAQSYNVMATGFQRSLAAIESAGLAPSGSLTHQMDSVLFKEGDTNLTKLQKLAQTRQIVEAGLETTIANPRVPKEMRDHAEEVVANIRKSVPFTQRDLSQLTKGQEDNPNLTLKDVVAAQKAQGAATAPARGLGLQQPGGAAAPKAPPGVRTATNPKTGEKLMLQNGQWVPLK